MTNLNIDSIKNFKNLSDRELYMLAEDIVTLRDLLDRTYEKTKGVERSTYANSEGLERLDRIVAENEGDLRAHLTKFNSFLRTFNGLDISDNDEELKVSVRGLNERLLAAEYQLDNTLWNRSKKVWNKIVNYFKRK